MKLITKELNKFISFVDRNFSYDTRHMKREDSSSVFDFFGINYDTDTIVAINNCQRGLYVSIKRNKKVIEQKFIKNFNELNNFKKMIKCLG